MCDGEKFFDRFLKIVNALKCTSCAYLEDLTVNKSLNYNDFFEFKLFSQRSRKRREINLQVRTECF